MRRFLPVLLLAPMLASASVALVPAGETLDAALARSRDEARRAEAEAERLEALATKAGDEAARLRARQAAAAQAIAAAEARISAADASARLVAARLAAQRQELARRQAPASALLAGLAMMGRRPPLLAIADAGSPEEIVRVRLLLDATLPVIRARTAALSSELARGRRLEQQLRQARSATEAEKKSLADRQQAFAALEQQALRLAEQRGSEALGAGDVALARSEQAGQLEGQAGRSVSARRLAAELAQLGVAPPRPFNPEGNPQAPPLAYRLPADAPVGRGFAEVSDAGIRARGLTVLTRRGQPLQAPAAGVVRFAGAYQRHDGVVIIDHGRGWSSLILNVRSRVPVGQRVARGQLLGHALGPISVELSQNGRHVSPALIAGSSAALSKGPEKG